ncbi:MAG: calcium/sodium antiporter [Candidatus Diapherotrites archaeon]
MLIAAIIFVLSGALIIKSADKLVEAAAKIAKSFGLSEFFIGMTIVAVGTSAPEIFTSVLSSVYGFEGITFGTLVGSNITNILLILGAIAWLKPIPTNWEQKRKDFTLNLIATSLLVLFCITGFKLGFIEGMLLVGFFFLALYLMIQKNHIFGSKKKEWVPKDWLFVLIGLIGLIIGSHFFVNSAEEIAIQLSIPEYIIGFTIVAIGTSLPELVTCITAAIKNKPGISIGAIVGSNLFNITFGLGISSMIREINIEPIMLFFHLPLLLGSTIILGHFIRKGRIDQNAGIIFLLLYALYIALTIFG